VLGIGRCLTILEGFYGPLPCPPVDPFRYLVWEILSLRTVPRKRDAALTALKHARALTPDSLGRAPQALLESAVGLAGPSRESRLQALRAGADLFRRAPELSGLIRGPLPGARRALKRFPQLGEDGARRLLLFASDHVIWPTDTRVDRVCRRLWTHPGADRSRRSSRGVQRRLTKELPATTAAFRRAFLYLFHHGSITCTERDPHCVVCPLRRDCPEGLRRIPLEERS
jgi:endonuclease-3